MKTVAAVLAALVLAGSAAAAPTPSQLQRQVSQLKGKVSALQSRVGVLERQLAETDEALVYLTNYAICSDALILDVIRAIVVFLGFSDPGRVDDSGACAFLGITRPRAALAAQGPPAGLAATVAVQQRLPALVRRR